jgi:hypothetical protein
MSDWKDQEDLNMATVLVAMLTAAMAYAHHGLPTDTKNVFDYATNVAKEAQTRGLLKRSS